jgi:NAD(P)-dependent dehydrogenase (short-subunit alcohol dehydrogenase family)
MWTRLGKGCYPSLRSVPERAFPFLSLPLISLFESNYFPSGQEMGGTAVYLASRAGGYVNGQEIVIDGGYVAVNPSSG